MNDELIGQFLAVTGCSDPSTATNYIEMSGGNLETAVGLFMEHGAGGAGASAGAAGAAGGGMGFEEDNIRAPDETRTMRLMDEGPMMMGSSGAGAAGMLYGSAMDPSMRLMQEMMDEQLSRSAFGPSSRVGSARDAVDRAAAAAEGESKENDMDVSGAAGVGNGGDEYNYDDDDDDDYEMETDDADVQPPVAPTLQDMFAAPSYLIHKAGGFQGARQMAKDSKRWLLVNIQKDSEFSSHALNRDVWRNDLVENLIQEGFIFWQEMDLSVEGSQYVQRYKVEQYPHIAIIDPRTGRLLWSKEGWTQQNPMTAETFAELAMDFCSRNSFDRPPQAPAPPKGPSSGGVPPPRAPSSGNGAATQQMSEEEQIQAAVNASLNSISQPSAAAAEASLDQKQSAEPAVTSNGVAPAAAPATAPEVEHPKEEGNSFLDGLLAMDVGEEPSSGGARLQLRMPNGKRMVRRFQSTDTVEIVYAFVAQTLKESDSGDKEFILKAGFPPKDLKSSLKSTVTECSLNGEAVSVLLS
eukprot:CAMPEP_0172447682 /NCGR_PEP_ID=MMETSP1065-20121228/6943_1 /TAXON_ID=265537 /ORGANISM="Amphiprora paludosa, Strain CCMP125" /LENGTH=522 /DNA_ID=CAMNT_0013199045 /DNA_START=144 /DNA_END=1712 /DNA_ORIENTATION=+